ncbi:MAG TPA: peptidylprolyl isomerase [Candidatus Koribacter sp.]|jgi:peptidyl-prolyl cis-trans isomerase SurA
MKKLVLPFLLITTLALPLLAGDDTVVEEIIARVNNQIITRADLRRESEQVLEQLKQQDAATADQKFVARQKDVLRDLIDQQLLVDKATDLGISADAEVIKQLDEMRKQMGLADMDALEKAAQEQGISFEDFKQNMKNRILTQRVISSEVGQHVPVTKEDEQKYYEAHKSEMDRPEQVRLSEILVPVDSSNDPDATKAQKKADAIEAELKSGKKFDEVAKAQSGGPTKEQGGDLGYFKRGVLAQQLEATVFPMKEGTFSDPIRTKQGWVIIKVTEHQQAGIPQLSAVEPKIQEAVYMDKLEPALRAYLTKLREEAYIDIKPGYIDTAASPNETKPIYTTAVDTHAKAKLKKKKKFGIF